jgi:glucosamine kinase
MVSQGPGDPTTVGVAESARQIRTAVGEAMTLARTRVPDGEVRDVVIGLAGAGMVQRTPGFARDAVPDDLGAVPRFVSDLAVAFCSATPLPDGYVLIAGAGAVAGRIVGDELDAQRDGWGWLLGDDGSGFWLGRSAVRSTLTALQQNHPLGSLGTAVLAAAGSSDYDDLLHTCYSMPPSWLATFATLVNEHAESDPVAAQIAAEAVRLLCDTALSLQPVPHQPIVLAGRVLSHPGPVSAAVAARLQRKLANPVLTSHSRVTGALWIALRHQTEGSGPLHARLVDSVIAAHGGQDGRSRKSTG